MTDILPWFSFSSSSIKVIINNAAVAQHATLNRTKEGFEAQIGANHFGHFLFTALLKPAILRAAAAASPTIGSPARIVNVSSVAASWDGELVWDDLHYKSKPEAYSKYPAYAKSKTANILFAVGLAKRFGSQNVLAYSLSPGGAFFPCNLGYLFLNVYLV